MREECYHFRLSYLYSSRNWPIIRRRWQPLRWLRWAAHSIFKTSEDDHFQSLLFPIMYISHYHHKVARRATHSILKTSKDDHFQSSLFLIMHISHYHHFRLCINNAYYYYYYYYYIALPRVLAKSTCALLSTCP